MQSQQSVVELLQQYLVNAAETEHSTVHTIQEFVQQQPAYWSRSTLVGHLTASAWITNAARDKAVLLHHRKLDIWVQPGGHIDDQDQSLLLASQREANEETGLQDFKLVMQGIFDVDIHPIPARKDEPAHEHLDIRFWFETADESLVLSDESNDLCWLSKEQIMAKTSEESVLRMVRKSMV